MTVETLMPKPKAPEPRALVVYYEGPHQSIILCDAHRPAFYSIHPDAYGAEEWKPVTDCERCRRLNPTCFK